MKNNYDLELKRQKQLKEKFNNNKTYEEKQSIKNLVDIFIQCKEITKEDYNKLIQYYFDIDFKEKLRYTTYKATDFLKYNDEEKYILNQVIKACFIIGY